ncbi:uncharacterized protein AMSG_07195 [Thecamonas trahens ATCC 50062]|uniref:Uncharacterized protein n=1 Tax=Thecamonas trahens ATCC 50062 TaxID=461836 RepID=A0A0L0DFE4_THETB|nr:hypothetical protein AMSG_07195 [Thecamonas trahens ATCC 50062]KNC50945.1 hypothetical protein AMSG_07195 [Thecamonas trahens ATCC 50062]|eukprot:XP_013756642.1 hypothetical protein AMSG_07195 [Thecamonas trahens ATCC 50062]
MAKDARKGGVGLEDMAAEVVHRVAFGVGVLAAADVVAMARTCRRLHAMLLGSSYSASRAHALVGFERCAEAGMWQGARLALELELRSEAEAEGDIRWRPRPHAWLAPVFAPGLAGSPGWADAVRAMAKARIVAPVKDGARVRVRVWPEERIEWDSVPDIDDEYEFDANNEDEDDDDDDDDDDDGSSSSSVLDGGSKIRDETIIEWCVRRRLDAMAEELVVAHAGELAPRRRLAMLREAAGAGMAGVVRGLVAAGLVDASEEMSRVLVAAAGSGQEEVVAALLTVEGVDPAARGQGALRAACEAGHVTLVELLLADPRVDPSHDSSEAFLTAADEGHAEVVALLLCDGRVDAGSRDNLALCRAAKAGHTAVVELILGAPGAEPGAVDNYPLRWAAKNGHADIVALLLATGLVNPRARRSEALIGAEAAGHARVVELLRAAM